MFYWSELSLKKGNTHPAANIAANIDQAANIALISAFRNEEEQFTILKQIAQ